MRQTILWLALALVSITSVAAEEGIRLRSGLVAAPTREQPVELPARLKTTDTALAAGAPVLVKLGSPITPEKRRATEREGIRLELTLGATEFVAYPAAGRLGALNRVPDLSWWSPYHPGLKIAPELGAMELVASKPYTLLVHLDSHADVPVLVASRLPGVDPRLAESGRPNKGRLSRRPGRLHLPVLGSDLMQLAETVAAWPETVWVAIRPTYSFFNDASAWVGQSWSSATQATPLYDQGLFGSGQILGIADSGIDADMCFFHDDINGLPPTKTGTGVGNPDLSQRKVIIVDFLVSGDNPSDVEEWDDLGHGTHVAGSAVGDKPDSPGLRDPSDGMAPGAKLVMQDAGAGGQGLQGNLYNIFQQAYLQGARIHSNSWGDGTSPPWNIYSDGSEDADAILWDHPDFSMFFAAGNLGPGDDTLSSPGTAKNVVTVGATRRANSAHAAWSFTSRGPSEDGRIKPDLLAPGENVLSASGDGDVSTNNCGTIQASGTSMATPTAAGLGALVREYYMTGFYPTGGAVPGDALTPSGALLKATLIASATPMALVWTAPPEPTQGWGRMLLSNAVYFTGDDHLLFAADVANRFTSGGNANDTHQVEVLNSGKPLRVVLTWTDYPSTPAASNNLVNDLDLRVQSPSGLTYRGNVFLDGDSQTGGSADRTNNVEVVNVPSPESGTWTITVDPFTVPQNSQGYGLVATAARGVTLDRVALTVDDTNGGNGNGVVDPGEWIDLDLTLRNDGNLDATTVQAAITAVPADVNLLGASSPLPDLAIGQQAASQSPLLQIRPAIDYGCAPLTVDLRYTADGYQLDEQVALPTGCTLYNPLPRAVNDLFVELSGSDAVLTWTRPQNDTTFGEPTRYRIYASGIPSGGFALDQEITDPSVSVSWDDLGAVGQGTLYYQVIAGNGSGDADPLP